MTHSSKSESGIVPIKTPPGRKYRETFSTIIRAFAAVSKA